MIKGHQFNKHLISVCCGFSTGIGGLGPRKDFGKLQGCFLVIMIVGVLLAFGEQGPEALAVLW